MTLTTEQIKVHKMVLESQIHDLLIASPLLKDPNLEVPDIQIIVTQSVVTGKEIFDSVQINITIK